MDQCGAYALTPDADVKKELREKDAMITKLIVQSKQIQSLNAPWDHVWRVFQAHLTQKMSYRERIFQKCKVVPVMGNNRGSVAILPLEVIKTTGKHCNTI